MNSTDQDIWPPGTFGPDGKVIKSPFYEYLVHKDAALAFVVLFGVTTFVHVVQAIYFRMWWLFPTVVLAGIGEVLGWSGRLWSSYSPLLQDPYLMQIVATILAPTPYVAALFIIFAGITRQLGVQYSRLSPLWYSRIFLTADIVALVVQAAGGGLAATASTQSGSNLGGNIMLGGIVFQLDGQTAVSMLAFASVAFEYYIRHTSGRSIRLAHGSRRAEINGRMNLLLCSLVFIVTCILIRSVYRTAELADGWNGRIITTEWPFNVFDGAMILLAMYTMNLFHPGYLMKSLGRRDDDYVGETITVDEIRGKKGLPSSTPGL
ncbi:hypothetical protein EIP91_000524 [Steccherinum ochraceum]|uniref:RTA1-domain-containing protein n=1 Tax=Steccherinum ochraceum TaxID=92696 RepID=A0A4R0RW47_9APHY|nr:hypothetical protein EIP91_000524 [Steccherinum ochraceum]